MADKNYSNIPLELKLKLKKIIDEDLNKNNNLRLRERNKKFLEQKKIEEEKATKRFKREKNLFITDKQASEGNPGDKELGIPVKPTK